VKWPWDSSQYAVDLGGGGSINADASASLTFNSNLYYGGSGPGWLYKTTSTAAQFSATGGAFIWSTAPSGNAGATATMTQRMSLSNTGALAVNQIIPMSGTYISMGTMAANNIYINGTTGSSVTLGTSSVPQYGIGLSYNGTASTNIPVGYALSIYNYGVIYMSTPNGIVVCNTGAMAPKGANTINAAGSIYSNGAALTSDLRLKKNVRPITRALDSLYRLNGVRFDWIETGRPSIGLIAQDVEQVYSELVEGQGEETKHLHYNGIIAVLVEAVKEQQEQINELRKAA
jgi:hypothetical protein